MFSTCFKYNINIDMVWIPGSENDKADFLSYIVENDVWSIPEYIYQIIEFNWGPHEVDWFASDHNFKLKVFYSRYCNMYSTGILILFNDKNVLIEIIAMHNVHVFL